MKSLFFVDRFNYLTILVLVFYFRRLFDGELRSLVSHDFALKVVRLVIILVVVLKTLSPVLNLDVSLLTFHLYLEGIAAYVILSEALKSVSPIVS